VSRVLRRLTSVAAAVALAGACATSGASEDGRTSIPPADRKTAPATEGVSLDGAVVSLSSYAGSPVVLHFWGSWCGPCHDEQKGFVAASRDLSADGVRFLGVAERDTRESARGFVRQYAVPYPSILDAGERILARYRLPAGFPITLVLDRQSRIAVRFLGPVSQSALVAAARAVAAEPA
jgi:peroxiredoxin